MHSFASFAIFAFSGSADFMIRATGAKLRMLASLSHLFEEADWFACCCDGEAASGETVGVDDMVIGLRAAGSSVVGKSCCSGGCLSRA